MLAGLTGLHLLVVAGAILLLFGATKLPVFAKSLGQTVKDSFGRLGDSEIFSGIMGSPQEH